MATKLKRIIFAEASKITAFILCIALCVFTVITSINYLNDSGIDWEYIVYDKYVDSQSFKWEFDEVPHILSEFLYEWDTEEYPESDTFDFDHKVYYYAKYNDFELYNSIRMDTEEDFLIYKYNYIFDNFDVKTTLLNYNIHNKDYFTSGYNASRYNDFPEIEFDFKIYFAVKSQYISDMETGWHLHREKSIDAVVMLSVYVLCFLFFLAYLVIVTGKKFDEESGGIKKEVFHLKTDYLFAEIWLSIIIILPFIYELILNDFSYIIVDWSRMGTFAYIFACFVSTVFFTAEIFSLLIIVRMIKGKLLIKRSFTFYFCKFALYCLTFILKYFIIVPFYFIKSFFDGRAFKKYPLTKRLFYSQMIYIMVSFIIVFTILVCIANRVYAVALTAFILSLADIVFTVWYVGGNIKTYREINKGFNESIEEQLKAERTKTALITNVSHDLKTPLTSIISYADLLSKEDNLSETAKEYIAVLNEKSNRLKYIVSDLFDLSKSTSGDIAVENEVLDIKRLIEQTLADMKDKIDESGKVIKTILPDNPVTVTADGKKLYRVLQNLIDNAVKYSLDGTRIYIELDSDLETAEVRIKNVSGYEMNFTVDDILQRFFRGDNSRTTEGSGLGLSIAETFTYVCGGRLNVEIDGDIFKVTLKFKVTDANIMLLSEN